MRQELMAERGVWADNIVDSQPGSAVTATPAPNEVSEPAVTPLPPSASIVHRTETVHPTHIRLHSLLILTGVLVVIIFVAVVVAIRRWLNAP